MTCQTRRRYHPTRGGWGANGGQLIAARSIAVYTPASKSSIRRVRVLAIDSDMAAD